MAFTELNLRSCTTELESLLPASHKLSRIFRIEPPPSEETKRKLRFNDDTHVSSAYNCDFPDVASVRRDEKRPGRDRLYDDQRRQSAIDERNNEYVVRYPGSICDQHRLCLRNVG